MTLWVRCFCALALTGAAVGLAAQAPRGAGIRVEITFSPTARAEPVTGMVYVAISRDNQRTPIDQASPTGAPLFSKYVEHLAPGTPATITADDRGHPLRRLRDLPAGDDMDSYYLNDAVEKLNEFLTKTQDPKFAGEVVFQRRAPHCWGPGAPDLLRKMEAQIKKVAPAGADLVSWKDH